MSMTIEQIRAERVALEKHLTTTLEAAVTAFQEKTGLRVEDVDVRTLAFTSVGERRATSFVSGVQVRLERL